MRSLVNRFLLSLADLGGVRRYTRKSVPFGRSYPSQLYDQECHILGYDLSGGNEIPFTPGRPPPRVQILSFRHAFSKRSRLGSPRPLRGPRPPTGNHGSATAFGMFSFGG